MEFINIGPNGEDFFNILPEDWQDIIIPAWEAYKSTVNIYVFRNGLDITVGGIVFRTAPPNMSDFETEVAQKYVDSGFHYIGFLFVDPKFRNQGLGSKWLKVIKEEFPNQSYWLTIEEGSLRSFYEKNGFICVSESLDKLNPEWVLIYQP